MRRLLIGILLFLLVAVHPVMAQTGLAIDKMIVKIWPEYDKPSALVIMDLFLAADISLPAKMTVRIPVEAGQPNSIAVRELDGQLYVLEYDSMINGDWNELTFTTPYPEVWLEYYDPQISINGDVRSYDFKWSGDHLVNQFNIEVQQPLTATSMTFDQNAGSGQLGSDGLTYFPISMGLVSAGSSFTLHMEYVKTDDTLSFSNTLAVQPSEPLNAQNNGRTSFQKVLPFLVGGLGLILILMGGFWYWRSSKNHTPVPVRRSHGGSRKYDNQQNGSVYCHQCGKRASSGDQFCRACGTRLRLEE